jgi:DNA-binding response OmpR family regulator
MSESRDLVDEVVTAAPNDRVDHARDGWEALEMLHSQLYEVFIIGALSDDDSQPRAAWLIRSAQRLDAPPRVLVATDEPTSTRMAASRPSVAHRFVTRPIDAAKLAAAARR